MPVYLFTDIESSTRLWEHHPESMTVALARHDEILHTAIAGAGGVLVKSTGDGLLAAFESVAAAVDAALVAQRGLDAESWTTPEPLWVRMGIHVGDGELRDGDYFGPAVNRAARIMGAAHGGQVLMSATAASFVSNTLPDGAMLTDLGTYRLKDLILPERLFQLSDVTLRSEFPAPVTLESRPNNLPTQISEFFGRESELASIGGMLDAPAARLVTLTGPGGVGKTRLALQVAADRLERYPDGACFVDLASETDPEAAYEAILRALDLPAGSGGSALERLTTRLRDARMLLVLDNLEQVTDAALGIIELVQRSPGLSVLTTSREALRVRGEHIYPVPALSLPDPREGTAAIAATEAVQLFVERARSVRPDFDVFDGNAEAVAEICLRLDGLPLALELAAARLNVFTPPELLDRLRRRLDILGAGGRDLPARQRTLWGAIGWSYELLDTDERALFEMMSVFSPTDLGSLEVVAESALGKTFILDTLSSLVDKSLIRSTAHEGAQQFSMLHTVREFAAEQLAADPDREARVRAAHAEFFSDLIERLGTDLRGDNRETALDALAATIGNLRAAWRFWIEAAAVERIFSLIDALWSLHDAKGWYHAAMQLAQDALDVLASSGGGRTSEELALRTSLARALMAIQGYTVEVERAFTEVLELAEDAGDEARRFPVVRALAAFRLNTADFPRAAELGETLIEIGEAKGDDAIKMEGHYLFGMGTAFSGDLSRGFEHLEKAIELFRPELHGRFRLGASVGVIARVAQGMLLWQSGSLGRATAMLNDALALARRLDHPYSLVYGLYHYGLFQVFRMRFEAAVECARELAVVAAEHEYVVWRTLATVLEGVARTGLGDVQQGLELTEAGIDLYRGLTTPPVFWPSILALRATVHAAAGDPAHALELVDEALEITGGGDPISADFWLLRGDILQMLQGSDASQVEAAYTEAIRCSAYGGLLTELRARARIVAWRRVVGATDDRSDDLHAVYQRFSEGFDEHDLVVAAQLLG